MQMTALWDTMPCSFVGVYRYFIGVYCLHHKGDESIIALIMEALSISVTPVYFSETTRRRLRRLSSSHLPP
jgi:hypothetical protein